MLRFSENILFTTQLIPEGNPRPDSWWYYGLDHGQHVSLFTRRSLELLAEHYGLNLYTDGRFIHLLSRKLLPPRTFAFVTHRSVAALLNLLVRRQSLVASDYRKVTGKSLT